MDDETKSKVTIYLLGATVVGLVIYLIYREIKTPKIAQMQELQNILCHSQQPYNPQYVLVQMPQSSVAQQQYSLQPVQNDYKALEQRMINLENKIDSLTKSNSSSIKQLGPNQEERKSVSMDSRLRMPKPIYNLTKADINRNTSEIFDMR